MTAKPKLPNMPWCCVASGVGVCDFHASHPSDAPQAEGDAELSAAPTTPTPPPTGPLVEPVAVTEAGGRTDG